MTLFSQLVTNKKALIGMAILAIVILVAIFAPHPRGFPGGSPRSGGE